MDPKTRGPYTPYKKTVLLCKDKSRTKQSDAKDADINRIMDKALKNGILPDPTRIARYEDLSTAEDFATSMETVLHAQKLFQELPSKLRQRLNNDPAEFLDWASNPENHSEMVKYGLKEKERPDVQDYSEESNRSNQGPPSEARSQADSESNQQTEGPGG